jgi:uncharacterized SAM-binding protein YcdF (DUF218 family)
MEMTPVLFTLYKIARYGLYPLTWIVFLTGLTTVLAFLPASPGRTRWLRGSAALSLALLIIMASPYVSYTLIGVLERQYAPVPAGADRHDDAIVVLGAGVLGKGTLRPAAELMDRSRQRTVCGVDLYVQKLAPTLLLAGGGVGTIADAPVEALEMKHWALRLGVPESAIRTEEKSRTTYENAIGVRRMLGETSILLVTSAAHMPRAAALFKKQGLHVTPAPCGYLAGNLPEDNWWPIELFDLLPDIFSLEMTTIAVTETAGILLYGLMGRL